MKLLICGECPDSLTTVAQGLNRMRSEQMRSEALLPGAPASDSAQSAAEILPRQTNEIPVTLLDAKLS